MALTIAVGFVVDDAVVMIENIMRHRRTRHADARGRAARQRQVGFTVMSMSISLIAVFISDLHGGHHGPAVPRIRHDALDRDPGLSW